MPVRRNASTPLSLLFSRTEIAKRVRALAAQIDADYRGRELIVVGVLKGAFIFMADLVRALHVPVTVDFVGLSSYRDASRSAGSVAVTRPLTVDIETRDVLVVEDILDTGLSMRHLLDDLRARRPASLRLCALVDKRERRTEDVNPDYVGFTLREGFVVGYGIDYAERYRELPDLHRAQPPDACAGCA